MDKSLLIKHIIDSHMSSDEKVYLIGLVNSAFVEKENEKKTLIDESILNPASSWGKKGNEEYKDSIEYYYHEGGD